MTSELGWRWEEYHREVDYRKEGKDACYSPLHTQTLLFFFFSLLLSLQAKQKISNI